MAAVDLLWTLVGLVVGWWLYVPVHELLHAAGCWLTGGEVSRLEIGTLYGGRLWEQLFPFVVAGGDYAGRLAGFDTGGRDLVYLATVFGPYVLTVFPGVWWLRRAGCRRSPLAFGLALPVALAPLISLPGDAYEIGSIVATRVPAWVQWSNLARGDDVFLVFPQLATAGWGALGVGVVALSLGLLWALGTYWLGGLAAKWAGEPALAPGRRR